MDVNGNSDVTTECFTVYFAVNNFIFFSFQLIRYDVMFESYLYERIEDVSCIFSKRNGGVQLRLGKRCVFSRLKNLR